MRWAFLFCVWFEAGDGDQQGVVIGSISQEAAILAIKATYIELLPVAYFGRLEVGNTVGIFDVKNKKDLDFRLSP
jgi:hypothetical protein